MPLLDSEKNLNAFVIARWKSSETRLTSDNRTYSEEDSNVFVDLPYAQKRKVCVTFSIFTSWRRASSPTWTSCDARMKSDEDCDGDRKGRAPHVVQERGDPRSGQEVDDVQ